MRKILFSASFIVFAFFPMMHGHTADFDNYDSSEVADSKQSFANTVSRGSSSSDYDFLVLAQFWNPASTFRINWTNPPKDKNLYLKMTYAGIRNIRLSDGYGSSDLMLHGLWPSVDRSSGRRQPTNCSSGKDFDPQALSFPVRKALLDSFSDLFAMSATYEYIKHGTCFDGSAEDYFAASIEYMEKNPTPEFMKSNIGNVVHYKELLDAFGGDSGHVSFLCEKDLYGVPQYLQEVRTVWNKDGTPRSDAQTKIKGACDPSEDVYIAKAGDFLTSQEHLYGSKLPKGTPVGFDIDETLFSSEQLFKYAKSRYKFGSDEFWNYVNSNVDIMASKSIARSILHAHVKRGNPIYFITARKCDTIGPLSEYLRKAFSFSAGTKINLICTESLDKSEAISSNGIKLYYGDADSDIFSAKSAGAEPVRILRSNSSFNNGENYHPGIYGEDVILASDV